MLRRKGFRQNTFSFLRVVNPLVRVEGRVLKVVGREDILVGGPTAVLVTCLHREAIECSAFPVGCQDSGA